MIIRNNFIARFINICNPLIQITQYVKTGFYNKYNMYLLLSVYYTHSSEYYCVKKIVNDFV